MKQLISPGDWATIKVASEAAGGIMQYVIGNRALLRVKSMKGA